MAVTLQNLLQSISGLGHAMLKFVHLVLDLLQAAKSRKCGFVNRCAGFRMYMLSEQTKTNVTGANYIASVCCLLATDQSKDRGFPGAVATDKTDALARIYLQRCAPQNVL